MKEKKIAILGLGYVGLPLALRLSLSYSVIGYDVDDIRIRELRKGIDKTLEVSERLLKKQQKNNLFFTNRSKDISNCNFRVFCEFRCNFNYFFIMLFSNTYNQITNNSKGIYKSKGSKFIAYAIIVKSEVQVVDEINKIKTSES